MKDGLIHSREELMKSRPNTKKMIILISDGAPDKEPESLSEGLKIKKEGIIICGIYIEVEKDGNPEFMQTISSPNLYFSSNYEGLVMTLQKLDLCT